MNQPTKKGAGALAGLRVVDLSRVLGGPMAAQTLADHGADVIKVEPPQGDEARDMGAHSHKGASAVYVNINRNKRGIALDLRLEEGRAVLLRLLENADVLIENFKAGTMQAWGLDYAALEKRFPRLIYASLTGFGSDGPLGGNPGYDVMVQAWTGLVSVNGSKETGPMRLGIPVVDLAAGSNVLVGILLSLVERQRSGRGQHIDIALYDAGLSITHPHGPNYLLSGKEPVLMGNEYSNLAPYSLFKAKRRPVFVAVGNDQQFQKMLQVIGREDLGNEPRFKTNALRLQCRDELRAIIEGAIANRDGEEVCNALLAAGVPAGLVQSIPDALAHPHTKHREMLVELGEYRWTGIPVKLSRTPGSIRSVPPEFNEHADAILAEAGYSPEEIRAFRERNVIGGPRAAHGKKGAGQ